MEWTSLNDLREKFTSFFESKGHLKLKSFSLIPDNDDSLLLINSGMAPMKKYFTGEVLPPCKKVTTCQKCIRTPDIERVGITSRHGTFFEMLGNFSFGDYFKKEATSWAWEFCTKILKLPIDKLWISIYENDDETFEIWTKQVGVNPNHIVRLGKEDNFWEHGVGPCGPCSEIYFDRGEKYGCGSNSCKVGCDCDRYIEFWNLVFTQFENDGKNNYTNLKHPNIDTGMGLERLACIMQNVDNLFLVDTIQNIMKQVSKISGIKYGEDEKKDISLRVITDHIRSITFMLGDGVMPSNEGRGYVLRRLLRRAARHGKLLGINDLFLSDVCKVVIKENEHAYPELLQKQKFIEKLIKIEEENFAKTIDQGLELLNNEIEHSKTSILSGEIAFKLNDTFGFPLDLTKEILSERDMTVDIQKFNELMLEQKNRSRLARNNLKKQAWKKDVLDFSNIESTNFVGYNNLKSRTTILKLIKENKFVDFAVTGEKVEIVLKETPFYARAGGQVGDSGVLVGDNLEIKILDTVKNSSDIYLHKAEVIKGTAKIKDNVVAYVDEVKRAKITRNHTAAHLLHSALKKVLGEHVGQAGQLVDENRLRFDFTHFSAVEDDELKKIEELINNEILKSNDVFITEMPILKAKEIGAIALFNEKYKDIVRVVKAGDFSVELCAGTHVKNTAQIGIFKIISEHSVASGVRRIEAITSMEVLKIIYDQFDLLRKCQEILKVNNQQKILEECESLTNKLKESKKTIDKLNSEIMMSKINELISCAKNVGNFKVIASKFDNFDNNVLKNICNDLKNKFENLIIVLANVSAEKANIFVSVGDYALKEGINANELIKDLAKLAGGNGGGHKDLAMAGVKDFAKIDFVLEKVYEIIEKLLDEKIRNNV